MSKPGGPKSDTTEAPVKAAPETPPHPKEAGEGAEAKSEVKGTSKEKRGEVKEELPFDPSNQLSYFDAKVKDGEGDFAGEGAISRARVALEEFLKKQGGSRGPDEARNAWATAAVDFMLAEAHNWKHLPGEFEVNDVAAAVQVLADPTKVGRSGAKGIGSFETWVMLSPHNVAYEQWKSELDRRKADAELSTEKSAALAAFSSAEKDIGAAVTFSGIKTRGEAVKEEINAADTKERLAAITPKIDAFKTAGPALKERHEKAAMLKARVADLPPKYQPEGTLANIDALTQKIEISDGTNVAEFDKELLAAEEKIKAKETEHQSKGAPEETPPAEAEEETPAVDKLLDFASQMEEGNMKKLLTTLAAALTSIAVAVAKLPWIGSKVRGTLISNDLLEKQGDPLAKLASKVEKDFAKFGLLRSWANQWGGKKTSDVVAMLGDEMKVNSLTTDPKKLAGLKQLRAELVKAGGDKNEAVLFEFMGNNPKWKPTHKAPESPPAAPPPATSTPPPPSSPSAAR